MSILYDNSVKTYFPVLRVYSLTLGDNFIPHPSPYAYSIEQKTDFVTQAGDSVTIPCFYYQLLNVSISENISGALNVSLKFPYVPNIDSYSDYATKELSVLYPKQVVDVSSSRVVFLVSDLKPSFLYKLDILSVPADNILSDFYNGTKTIADVNAFIDTYSMDSYWLYANDYSIIQQNKEKTLDLTLTDISYKLKDHFVYKTPEVNFIIWAYRRGLLASKFDSFFTGKTTYGEIKKIEFPPAFDGFSIVGFLLACLYYGGLFPDYIAGMPEEDLTDDTPLTAFDNLTLNVSEEEGFEYYSIVKGEDSSEILVVEKEVIKIDSNYIYIPISNVNYPYQYNLLSNGYYLLSSPYKTIIDFLKEFAELRGFFWRFNENAVLEITKTYYKQPSEKLKFNGQNLRSLDYNYDDTNLRNAVSVFGRPFSSDAKVEGYAESTSSIHFFGRKHFIFDHNMIMTQTQANNIAQNLLNIYAFNIGQIKATTILNYTTPLKVGQDVVFDVLEKFSTIYNDEEYFLTVSEKTINIEKFKPATLTFSVIPKTERLLIDLPVGFDNYSEDSSFSSDYISITTEDSEMENDLYNGTVINSYQSKQYFTVDLDIIYGDFRVFYNASQISSLSSNISLTVKIYYYYEGELVTTETINRTINEGIYFLLITGTSYTSSSYNFDIILRDPLYSFDILSSHNSDLGNIDKIKIEYSLAYSMLPSIRVNTFNLSDDLKLRLLLKYKSESENAPLGFIEGGLLVIPSSTKERDNKAFDYFSVEGETTIKESNIFPLNSVGNILFAINSLWESGIPMNGEEITTYGALKDIATISLSEERGNIIENVQTSLYAFDSTDNFKYLFEFDPFIKVDNGYLCYANTFIIVPYIIVTDVDGNRYLKFKGDIFITHFNVNDNIRFEGVSSNKIKIGNSYEYQPAQLVSTSLDSSDVVKYNLNPTSGKDYFSIRYKSTFPFMLHVAILDGRHNLLSGDLRYINYKNVHFISKILLSSKKYSTTVKFPVFTNLEEIVNWCSDASGNNDYAITLFVNPFYKFGLDDYLDLFTEESEVYKDKDKSKLSLFGVAASKTNSINSEAVATYIWAYENGYPKNDEERVVDFSCITYNKNNFTF